MIDRLDHSFNIDFQVAACLETVAIQAGVF